MPYPSRTERSDATAASDLRSSFSRRKDSRFFGPTTQSEAQTSPVSSRTGLAMQRMASRLGDREEPELTPDQIERLRALGYLD